MKRNSVILALLGLVALIPASAYANPRPAPPIPLCAVDVALQLCLIWFGGLFIALHPLQKRVPSRVLYILAGITGALLPLQLLESGPVLAATGCYGVFLIGYAAWHGKSALGILGVIALLLPFVSVQPGLIFAITGGVGVFMMGLGIWRGNTHALAPRPFSPLRLTMCGVAIVLLASAGALASRPPVPLPNSNIQIHFNTPFNTPLPQ